MNLLNFWRKFISQVGNCTLGLKKSFFQKLSHVRLKIYIIF